MKPTFSLVLATLSAIGMYSFSILAQDCWSCMPALNPAVTNISGGYTVCIIKDSPEGTLSSDVAEAMGSALNEMWGDYLSNNGLPVAIYPEIVNDQGLCPPQHDVKVSIESVHPSAYASVVPTSDGRNTHIKIEPSTVTGSGFSLAQWKSLIAHEFGHILGFENVDPPPDCVDYSIMSNGVMPTGWPAPGGTNQYCGDFNALSQRFPPDPTSGGAEEPVPDPDPERENCFLICWVTRYWNWTGEGWHNYYTNYYCYDCTCPDCSPIYTAPAPADGQSSFLVAAACVAPTK